MSDPLPESPGMPMDPLQIDDHDRYGRLRLIPWWDQQRLRRAKVLVVGAGALGNEVLKNLALVGVGQLVVIDFDTIENSNLTRSVLFRSEHCGRSKAEVAAAAVRDLNPDIHVLPLAGNVLTDLGLGVFREADVVVGCLDNREARLWVNRCCWKVATPWVDGGIQEINGVVKVFVPPDGACYECTMTEMDYRLLNLRYSCPLLRQEDLQSGKVPTAPTIASMIGGWQAQEALKLLHGMPAAAGQALVFNGISNQFYATRLPRKDDCLSHETYPSIEPVAISNTRHTLADLFRCIQQQTGSNEPQEMLLDRDLIVSLECSPCARQHQVLRLRAQMSMREAECPHCGQPMRPKVITQLTPSDPLAATRLCDLGVPAYDIVRIATGSEVGYYQLEDNQPLWERSGATPASGQAARH